MRKLTSTSILFIKLLLTANSLTAQNCACLPTSLDKIEKLIALMASGSDAAKDFYLNNLQGFPIDEDLKTSCIVFLYPSRWEEFKKVEKRYKDLEEYTKTKNNKILFIKKYKESTKNENDANFWIQTGKLDCLKKIIASLKSNPRFSKNKKVRKAGIKKDEEIEINKGYQKPVKLEPETLFVEKTVVTLVEPPVKNPNLTNPTTAPVTEAPLRIIASDTIYFNEGEIKLDKNDVQQISNLVMIIKSSQSSEVTIEGFASTTGSRETNMAISMSRCFEVKSNLQSNGFSGRFNVLPFGETDNNNFRAVVITVREK